MLSVSELNEDQVNPLDSLELLISEHEWPYERLGNEEIVVGINGQWCDFHLRYIWLAERNILQSVAQLDLRVLDRKRGDVLELITQVNDRIDLGHFGVWSDDNTVLFSHSFILPTSGADVVAACDLITRSVITEIDRYYPVFQFVIWGGKSAEEAIEAAMLETVGNA